MGVRLFTQHKSSIQLPKKLKSIQAGNFELPADIRNLHFAGVRRYRRLMGYDCRSQCLGFGNNPCRNNGSWPVCRYSHPVNISNTQLLREFLNLAWIHST